MRVDLAVPYRDTAAADLLVAVGALRAPEALAARRVGGLELRVLGASHAVVVEGAGLVEVVACGAPSGTPLAGGVRRSGGLVHTLEVAVEPLARAHGEAVRALADRPDALVAAFPGAPDALTALRADADGWSSWHLYPATGEAVRTTTTLAPA